MPSPRAAQHPLPLPHSLPLVRPTPNPTHNRRRAPSPATLPPPPLSPRPISMPATPSRTGGATAPQHARAGRAREGIDGEAVRAGGAPAGSEQEHRVVHVPGVPRSICPTLCSPYLPRCWGIQIEQVRCRRSMISMRCAGEATVMLVVDASAVFHRHTAAPSDAALPRDERPGCRSAGTEPRARQCHGHGGLQGTLFLSFSVPHLQYFPLSS